MYLSSFFFILFFSSVFAQPLNKHALCFTILSNLTKEKQVNINIDQMDMQGKFIEELTDQKLQILQKKTPPNLPTIFKSFRKNNMAVSDLDLEESNRTLEESSIFLNKANPQETSLEHALLRAKHLHSNYYQGKTLPYLNSSFLIKGRKNISEYLDREENISSQLSLAISNKIKEQLPWFRASNFFPLLTFLNINLLPINTPILAGSLLMSSGIMIGVFKIYHILSMKLNKKNHPENDFEYEEHLRYIKNHLTTEPSNDHSSSWSFYGNTLMANINLSEAIKEALDYSNAKKMIDDNARKNIEDNLCDSCYLYHADIMDNFLDWIKQKIRHPIQKSNPLTYSEIVLDHIFYKNKNDEPVLMITASLLEKRTVAGQKIKDEEMDR